MYKTLTIITIVVAAFSVLIISSFKTPEPAYVQSEQTQARADLHVQFPDGSRFGSGLPLTGSSAAKDLASLDASLDELEFAYTEYDFGSFITGINGVEADTATQFWELSVNGQPSGTGISDLVLQQGDNISFQLINF